MTSFENDSVENERERTVASLAFVAKETKALLQSGEFNYDEYINILIRDIGSQAVKFIKAKVKDSLISGYSPEITPKIESIITRIKEINVNYVSLLLDPLICIRAEKFINFAKDYPLLSPKDIREKFIEQFPTKTYYRAIILWENQKEYVNSHLAPNPRKIIKHQGLEMDEYVEYLEKASVERSVTYREVRRRKRPGQQKVVETTYTTPARDVERFDLPLMGRVYEKTKGHVANRQTDGDFVSITEYPEIAWYVVCHNGKEHWKGWDKKTKVRIYKFQMNSFYAPSAQDVVWGDIADNHEDGKAIVIEDKYRVKEFSLNDKGIEQLVPLSLPKNFTDDFIDFVPEWDETSYRFSNFTIPSEQDWMS